MNAIERLIELSPCKVEFVNLGFYYGGQYWNLSHFPTNSKIQINNTLQKFQQLGHLAHEVGHALCETSGCKCFVEDDEDLREYHGYKYALGWLLKHKCKDALQDHCSVMVKITSLYNSNDPHVKAIHKMMKLKLWEKCKKFIEEEGDE